MTDIAVSCTGGASGWSCDVVVADQDGSASRHRVTLSAADLAHLDPGAADPVELVHRSFEFLLAREPKTSILATFDLPRIGHYFPEFEQSIQTRRGPDVAHQ